jgi:hypothetical protein
LKTALDLDCYTAIQQKKMEQMSELLKAMQERVETQIGSLACKMDTSQAEMKATQPKIDASQDGCLTSRNAGMMKRDEGWPTSGSLPGE